MSRIYYEVPILDDEGNQYAELDATVYFDLELENGEPVVNINRFEVKATNGKIKSFSANEDDVAMRTLFLRGKEALEYDDAFIGDALESDDSIVYHGKGANDPDAHWSKVA